MRISDWSSDVCSSDLEGLEDALTEEGADLRDLGSVELQDLELEGSEGAVRLGHVEAVRRLAVGERGEHRHVVGAAGALGVDEAPDVLVADVPTGEGRHFPDGVALEQDRKSTRLNSSH